MFSGATETNLLLLKKSYCLKAEEKYEEAYTVLQRADFFQGSDSLKFKLYYESALNAFLFGKYDLSFNKIQELRYYLPAMAQPMIDLLEMLTLNQQQKLGEAEKIFASFLIQYHLANEPNIYHNKKFKKFKNPAKAESVSHLLPGAGQMYAGYGGQGVTSLLIQSGLIAFTAYSFVNGFYFSGAFTGVGLFYMFNNGGARHAQYLAEKKNKELINQLNTEVKLMFAKAIKK